MTRAHSKSLILAVAALTLLFLAVLAPAPLYGQVAGATVSGTVTDVNGGPIPGATISIKNVATEVTRDLKTNDAGFYSVPNLLPGSYEVTVAAPGFSTEVRSGIRLTVGAQQVLNLTMKVGQITQKVQVTGEAPAVQLASSTISGVVSETAVVQLPLNGRDLDATRDPAAWRGFRRADTSEYGHQRPRPPRVRTADDHLGLSPDPEQLPYRRHQR
jgi:hypothetical protein